MRGRQIVHIDMDAFYASVEQRDDPSLRGVPVIVGGASLRSVVTTASYEARPFGVRSAMPMTQALRLCPDARVVAPDFAKYARASRAVFAIFRRYTPLVEGLSLDEAFLDVTASRALFGDARAIAQRIREDIARELSLSASAGVASTKFVAKIASDLEKPAGLVVVEDAAVAELLRGLPIERMWGLGPKGAARARGAGIQTLGELASATDARLERLFGARGPLMARLARGDDPRPVDPNRRASSISAEQTFETDLREPDAIERGLLDASMRVAARLCREGLSASAVAVKLKYADFSVRTRAAQLADPANDTDTLFRTACSLLPRFAPTEKGVRLVGVAASKLTTLDAILPLLRDERRERGGRLEAAQAKLREKFGAAAITRAALLGDPRAMGLGEARDRRDRER